MQTMIARPNEDSPAHCHTFYGCSGGVDQPLGFTLDTTGPSLYGADPQAIKEDRGAPGRVFASKEAIVSAGAFNITRDHYIVGTVGKASTELLLLKQCTFLDMNDIADGQHPCYDKWHDGIGGLFKGGYTTNGIGFGYFRNS
ncbi:hypothetical protein Cob_v002451 [Colletotrichum orbiculare MAFF 240422]|uniref:Uncharacterized protein n=1 Tax=Colletotrichum orbiculare (strain 104-T / ATCC 96160 / CBS 514.97 / LARS 414 / MAFF 240422) TaxID=1213857 RepID=A0A484G4H6_COLOR|nr:hypothetical protein Cob_v002451 [Colletotrichum orbiculare MAFF 240422]